MNSHEWDSVDALFQQALQPCAEVTPPKNVWLRIVERLHSIPAPMFIRAPFWSKLLAWLPNFRELYFSSTAVPYPQSNRPYCASPYGRCQPSPFVAVMIVKVLDLRISA